MRDEKRITVILGEIEKTWKENPDMRFLQLLINMGLIPDNQVFWNLEDDRIIEHLETHPLKENK